MDKTDKQKPSTDMSVSKFSNACMAYLKPAYLPIHQSKSAHTNTVFTPQNSHQAYGPTKQNVPIYPSTG